MDIATMIVDLLRKKEEDKALQSGGPTALSPQVASPAMLGGGIAQKGGALLEGRKDQLARALASAGA